MSLEVIFLNTKTRKNILKVLRVVLVVSFVFFLENSSVKMENKIVNENLHKTLDLTSMAEKVQENIDNDIFTAFRTHTGDLTGYVFNCPLCGGTLACRPSYNIKDGTTTFPDEMYGTVNIVASSRSLPCGSIVRFNAKRISDEPIIAIVLDRGVLGTDIDILAPSYDFAIRNVGRSKVTYDVLRVGWER